MSTELDQAHEFLRTIYNLDGKGEREIAGSVLAGALLDGKPEEFDQLLMQLDRIRALIVMVKERKL